MEKLAAEEIHVLPWKEKEEDRISILPEELLHRILDFSDSKAAAKTCVLSKSWRYVWCTNPKLKFSIDPYLASTDFPLDKILQSYHDRNLFLDEFSLFINMWHEDIEVMLLNKWIPMIIQDMRVKTFHLSLINWLTTSFSYELPSLILDSDHIQELTLLGGLASIMFKSTLPRVNLKHLHTLSLICIDIPEHIKDSIFSTCLLLERLTLAHCLGFTRIKLFTNTNKKLLPKLTAFSIIGKYGDHDVSIEIGDDHIRTLKTIELQEGSWFPVSRNKPLECARLTRLSLRRVQLMSWESFSCNLHSLEELMLDQCYGIEEFKLSSRSMKRLDIHNISKPFRVKVDAPSIVSFNYEGFLPQSISFATTSADDFMWKSEIILGSSSSPYDDYVDVDDDVDDNVDDNDDDVDHVDDDVEVDDDDDDDDGDGDDEPSRCFNELYGLLLAVSKSKISLALDQIEILQLWRQLHIGDDGSTNGVSEEAKHYELPVVVENLRIKVLKRSMDSSDDPILNSLFYMFRPSFMYMGPDMLTDSNNKLSREIAELLLKETIHESYIWERVLEEVSLQVLYRNQSKWQPVEHTSFSEVSKKGADGELELRIQFTWRD